MAILKRGLSDIVTNVLIILLVLVAIGIIWLFVRPFIQAGAGGVAGADQCLTVSVEPVKCVGQTVTVVRNQGSGDVLGVGIQIKDVTDGNLKTMVSSSLAELNSLPITVGANLDLEAGDKVRAFAVVKTTPTDTVGRTCAVGITEVTCV